MSEKHLCPVCGEHRFDSYGSFDYCPVCFWVDDAYQEDFPDETGSNCTTLNKYRERYKTLDRTARMRYGKDLSAMRADGADGVDRIKKMVVRFDSEGNKGMSGFTERFAKMSAI